MGKQQNKKLKQSPDKEEKVFEFFTTENKDKNLENQSIQKSDSQTVTTTDTVFSEAKNAETSWAAQIEEIEEAKLKNMEAKTSQEPQRTRKTTANSKTNHVQTNNKINTYQTTNGTKQPNTTKVDHQKQTETRSVNAKTTTSKPNKTTSPDTEHVSDKKDQSASDTSPSHEKTLNLPVLQKLLQLTTKNLNQDNGLSSSLNLKEEKLYSQTLPQDKEFAQRMRMHLS